MARRADTPEPQDEQTQWASISAAAAETGLSVATIRVYANGGHVRTRQGTGPRGARLEVSVDDVIARRAATGGDVEVGGQQTVFTDPDEVVELRERLAAAEAKVPDPGAAVVPLAQWELVLGQLGNLHQAGQDLAEARERAARAETEAQFLRERLRELQPPAGSEEPAATPRRRLFRRS